MCCVDWPLVYILYVLQHFGMENKKKNLTSYAFFQSCISEITEWLNIKFGNGDWH